ncbi:MAG: hypothetical protein ACREJ3_05295 [Polyangiaceae bacterium]
MPRFSLPAVATLAVLSLPCACGKKGDSAQLAPAASTLAPSTVADSGAVAKTWHYAIDPKSVTKVDMPGIKEHIMADTSAAAGMLDVVPADLTQSRGTVKIDLTTLKTHTFGTGDDATQTKHALTWLEVAGDAVKANLRYADFAIRSIDHASATDLSVVPAVKAGTGGQDVRTVTLTVHGDVLIHGHQVEKEAVVDASFVYPPGTAAGAMPSRIEVKSKTPMRVVLKELDVRPRDPAGQLLDWTTKLISKVAETADISVDLGATPAQPSPGAAP